MNNNGDCLLATTIARQIKNDYPNSCLTWAIGECCESILINNPYVDRVLKIPLSSISPESVIKAWEDFVKLVTQQKEDGIYDLLYFTQYSYGRYENFMGITRASIFSGYPSAVTVPLNPVLQLTSVEKQNVELFSRKNRLEKYSKVILFECTAFSGQSFIDTNFINEFCKLIFTIKHEYCVILSSKDKFDLKFYNVIDASDLTFRENAELINYCDLFLGCSSGISWLSISNAAKEIPKILLLNDNCPQASMILDHKYFNLPHDKIVELRKCNPEEVLRLIENSDFNDTRFDTLKIRFNYRDAVIFKPFDHQLAYKNWRNVLIIIKKANISEKTALFFRFSRWFSLKLFYYLKSLLSKS